MISTSHRERVRMAFIHHNKLRTVNHIGNLASHSMTLINSSIYTWTLKKPKSMDMTIRLTLINSLTLNLIKMLKVNKILLCNRLIVKNRLKFYMCKMMIIYLMMKMKDCVIEILSTQIVAAKRNLKLSSNNSRTLI